MPPVAATNAQDQAEEDQNPSQEGVLPRHLPLNAMAGMFGPTGQSLVTSADIFRNFSATAIIGELVAGLQDWVTGEHDDPDSPKTEEGKRKQAQTAAQEMADAFQSYGDSPWEQQWMADTHTIAGTTMTGANFIRLGKSMHDKNFRALLQQRLEGKGLSETEAEKAMNDGARLIYLKSKESKTEPERQEMRKLEADPKAGFAIQEGDGLLRTLDAGPQGPTRTEESGEQALNGRAAIDSLSGKFDDAGQGRPPSAIIAAQTNIDKNAEAQIETPLPKQEVKDEVALESARQKTQTISMGLG
jgi:hypothetical protein